LVCVLTIEYIISYVSAHEGSEFPCFLNLERVARTFCSLYEYAQIRKRRRDATW